MFVIKKNKDITFILVPEVLPKMKSEIHHFKRLN